MNSQHERTFTCPCQKQVTVTVQGLGCYNVGEVIDKTRWKPVFQPDGDTIWLCVECKEKAMHLGQELKNIMGTASFHFSSLIRSGE